MGKHDGEQHYRWTVIGPAPPRNGREMVLCRCVCGTVREVRYDGIKRGSTKSCGCLRDEKTKTHGLTDSRLYNIWRKMKERCYNKNHVRYLDYGGRGISVCGEWRNNFSNFHAWATENGYSDSLTLDRVDTNGNYEPSNCKWSTSEEQQNNTRFNRVISAMGKSQTISMWSRELSIPYSTIYSRLCKGWSEEEALTVPTDKTKSSKRRVS